MTRTLRAIAAGLSTLGLTALTLRLAAQQQPAADSAGTGFWEQNRTTILLGVLMLVIGVILSETIKALLRKLGSWIERRLQSFGWQFRKRYLRALIDDHRWLKLIGVYSRADLHPPRLREVYVSLRLAAGGPGAGPRFTWHELFSEAENRLVILGPPGAGKSTLIDYLILVFTGHVASTLRDRLRRPLPLFGQLRKLGSESGPATVLELLRTSTLKRVPADFPERQLRRGNAVVFLDGLDEVLDEDRHRQVVEEIRQLVREYPDNRYVVTCRVAGWRHQLEDFRTYEIQELSDDDVRQFIGAWYREVLRTQMVNLLGAQPEAGKLQEVELQAFADATERADSLWQALAGNENLLRIARTPLLLSLITLVHYHRVTDLPKGRAKLYEQCLEILLELWDRQDKRLQVSGPSWKEKLLILREMSFYYLREDLLETELPSLEAVVGPLLPKLKEETTAAALIEHIWKRSGILVEVALGRYGFAHRALQDYLAAAHVVWHELDDLLLRHSGEERWREVILIAVGLVPEKRARRLLGSFMSDGRADASALEMAGLGLAEDVQVGDDLRAAIRRRLLDRLGSEESSSRFGRLAGALVVADPEAARSWVAEALRGRDPGLRERLLQLLPDLGKEHAGPLVPLLVRLVGAADEDLRVRSQAVRALVALEIEPDGEVWEVLARVRRERSFEMKAAATWAWCEMGRCEELGLVRVPAGEFLMGDDEMYDDEKPQHALYLPTFYIGRHPVTVAQFREFVEEAGFKPNHPDCLKGEDEHPVVRVNWDDALAYARWYGCTLPSEAEWEKAARGTDGRHYPWGNEWQRGLANTREYWTTGRRRFFVLRRRSWGTTPVGQFSPGGDSPYGCADMAGNVWEWTRSIYQKYPYDPLDGREDLLIKKEASRVLRGGSFGDGIYVCRCAVRYGSGPDFVVDFFGWRVVAPISEL